jgi:hypothetical protein
MRIPKTGHNDSNNRFHRVEPFDIFLSIKKIPAFLWNPKFHCRIYKRPPLDFILSQFNPFHIFIPYLFKTHFNNLSHRVRSPKWCFPSCFPTKILYPFLFPPHVLHIPAISSSFRITAVITSGEDYKLWNSSLCIWSWALAATKFDEVFSAYQHFIESSLCNFPHPHVTFYHFGPDTVLNVWILLFGLQVEHWR